MAGSNPSQLQQLTEMVKKLADENGALQIRHEDDEILIERLKEEKAELEPQHYRNTAQRFNKPPSEPVNEPPSKDAPSFESEPPVPQSAFLDLDGSPCIADIPTICEYLGMLQQRITAWGSSWAIDDFALIAKSKEIKLFLGNDGKVV
jgi:hypothetical protein